MPDMPALSAGNALREQADALAEAVVACEFGRYPQVRARYGPRGGAAMRQDAYTQFEHLAAALDVDSPLLFDDHVAWFKQLQLHRGACVDDLDHHLGCMAEALRSQSRGTALAAALQMISGARERLAVMPGTTASIIDLGRPLSTLAHDYMRALLGGYRQSAARLVFDAAERGESLAHLYLQVFQPALREIGRLWLTNQISVAQEHFCSAATQILMAQLLPRAPDAAHNGRSVIVCCVAGEMHDLGARMVADLFEMAGWDGYFCGANTPHEAIAQAAVERGAEVLAVSASMDLHLRSVRELISRVRSDARCAALSVIVGGHPFDVDPALWQKVGADGTAPDAGAAVALAERCLNARAAAP